VKYQCIQNQHYLNPCQVNLNSIIIKGSLQADNPETHQNTGSGISAKDSKTTINKFT